jgi:parallel beta-helix repeat protein
VYLDDNAGGVDVIGNIVVRCPRAGLHLHNGRDNKIENNIFAESRLQQVEYNGWTGEHPYWKSHLKTMIEGYEMVANQPAWQKMRNMDIHPNKAVLPDGKIMSGNQFRKNIIYYRDPDAKLFSFRNVPWDHYESDYNLVWHFDRPLLTGQTRAGKPLSENLVSNPSFETGRPGALPKDWTWQMRPQEASAAVVEQDAAGGKRSLTMTGGIGKEPNGREFHPQVVSAEFPVKPGHSYRLAAKMKAQKPGAKATLMLQSYVANVYYWANSPSAVKVGTEWTDGEFVFKIPAPGQRGYNDQMKKFRVRIDFAENAGTLWVDDVSLCEVEMLDEWAAWQAMGFDKHSLVADPQFVDPDKDDYRLKPDSPALKLGFRQIPVERIGPYRDELRATWPIVEAEGAREKPLGGSEKR